MARLTPNTLNTAAAVYLVSRVAYNLIYINGTTSTFTFHPSHVSWRGHSLKTITHHLL